MPEYGRLWARREHFDNQMRPEQIAVEIRCSFMTVRTILKGGRLNESDRLRLQELERQAPSDPVGIDPGTEPAQTPNDSRGVA